MELNELRIGNYIAPLGKGITQVEGMCTWDSLIQSSNFAQRGIEDFEPIPLTEEWLVKFGLEYKSPFGYRIKMGSYIKDDLETNGYFFRWNGKTIKLMHYVHELQNIYFALTGEELKLNK